MTDNKNNFQSSTLKRTLALIFVMFITLSLGACGGGSDGDNDSGSNLNNDNINETLSYISLKSMAPETVGSVGNMSFSYDGAIYDTDYTESPHWKITYINGYMAFSFVGGYDFKFHALGSTSEGISYTYIDIYINDILYESDKFIKNGWADYIIPASKFNPSYTNTVKIVLTGNTHVWIDSASIGNFQGDQNNEPAPDSTEPTQTVEIDSLISTITEGQLYRYSQDNEGMNVKALSVSNSASKVCYFIIENFRLNWAENADSLSLYDDIFSIRNNGDKLSPDSQGRYRLTSSGGDIEFVLNYSLYSRGDNYVDFKVDCDSN